ncbi:MAG: peptidoglycan editing factor PgeF [Lachnospira sp.]|nr:peptidoglycan editing factor PgeF [Lachnospira sp.]
MVEADNGVVYLKYSIFEDLDFVKQGFSTRKGGVSEGIYSSMNLTFLRDDSYQNVKRNFELMGQALGIKPEDMVYSKQTHTTNVLKVSGKHRGLGVTKEHIYDDVDGLITNESNVCLVTAYADCIPVIVVDPVNKAIGAAHAGWKGTVGNIVNNMITFMSVEYGTKPGDIKAFVGPGICEGCYEVSEDVFLAFNKVYSEEEMGLIIRNGANKGKYQLNLPMANVINLYKTGVDMTNIAVADICTCCNSELLFSHRATNGQRGILCNFIEII